MSTHFSYLPDNPYASSALIDEEPVAQPQSGFGSLALLWPGILLLLVGYVTSNLIAISALYQLPIGNSGEPISPLGGVDSPAIVWLFYAALVAAVVAGSVMVGSQNFHPSVMVVFVMCPVVSLAWLVGWPLRVASRFTLPFAFAYLALGTCLAGAGMLRLIMLYGVSGLNFEPCVASLMTQSGLALLVGAFIALNKYGALTSPKPREPASTFLPAQP